MRNEATDERRDNGIDALRERIFARCFPESFLALQRVDESGWIPQVNLVALQQRCESMEKEWHVFRKRIARAMEEVREAEEMKARLKGECRGSDEREDQPVSPLTRREHEPHTSRQSPASRSIPRAPEHDNQTHEDAGHNSIIASTAATSEESTQPPPRPQMTNGLTSADASITDVTASSTPLQPQPAINQPSTTTSTPATMPPPRSPSDQAEEAPATSKNTTTTDHLPDDNDDGYSSTTESVGSIETSLPVTPVARRIKRDQSASRTRKEQNTKSITQIGRESQTRKRKRASPPKTKRKLRRGS